MPIFANKNPRNCMKTALTTLLLCVSALVAAQQPIEMNLWPNGPKTSNGDPTDLAKIMVYLPYRIYFHPAVTSLQNFRFL